MAKEEREQTDAAVDVTAVEVVQDQSLSVRETEEVLAIGIDVGRIEALDFVATVATTSMLAVYEKVKKSRGWRFVRNPESGDGSHFQSLDEFCKVKLGRSYRRMRELAANHRVLGQDAFEQAERLGLRQVDHNAMRALPAPEQELVRQAIEEAESRDEVLDLLQQLATRTGQQKEALEAEVQSLKDDATASERLIENKNKRIDTLEREVALIQQLDPDEYLERLQQAATTAAFAVEAAILGHLRQAMVELRDHAGAQGDETGQDIFMAGLMGQAQRILSGVRDEFHLPDVSKADDQRLLEQMAEWDK